jgi:alpha-glucosidase
MPARKMKFRNIFSIGLLVVIGAGSALAAPSNVQTTTNGVYIHLGAAEVELAAANSNIFRLSVCLDGAPHPADSSFLALTNSSPVAWQWVSHWRMVGIKTAAGELLMNPRNGQWMLENAKGKTLIPRHAIGDFPTNEAASPVSLTLGWKKRTPISVYGCGNGTNALEQSKATTGVANGVAVIPYYWSKAGYAVLAVTANDNRPAHWMAATNGESAVTWTFPGANADLYLMPAVTLKDAAKNYADLTGHAPVPPRWAFGYLQSRWGWQDRAYIENTLTQFLTLKIPVDAFIYDFEWYTRAPDYSLPPSGTADYNDFSWNTNLFPNPVQQIKAYKAQGVHFIGIRKPRMGNATSLAMIRAEQWNLGGGGRENFESRDVDFANPDLREWYISRSTDLFKAGVDGWWNDEGEASFTTYYYWNLTEQEAMDRFRPGERLWTLNRAFSPGMQRLGAAAWTGDIRSSWKVLAATPTSLLNWTLAGLPYETCDIGGFFGHPSQEMLSRWMEAGVFFPVMRSHSEIHETPRFPWLYGPDALNAIRKALDLRYQLIPYYYSLAHETTETGVPLMRPLVMEFPDDKKVANMSDEWLMGSSLLAAPILGPDDQRTVYLPDDQWYAFESNTPLKGKQTINVTAKLDEIPMYVHAGTILPLAPVIQHTSQLPGGPLELEIYPGKDATFTLVEDDGRTTAYMNGRTLRTTFTWNNATGQLSWTREGKYSGRDTFQKFHAVVFDPRGKVEATGTLSSSGSVVLMKSSS